MLYTEESAKANIRNREGRRVFYLGPGDQLTPGARDWLRQEKIEVLPSHMAKQTRYRLAGGGFCEEKPEHMTHLNGEVLVPKTHPRIVFRGAMDTLEAELILAQLAVPEMASQLGEVLKLAREILRCDVLEETLPAGSLCGMTEAELRERSHRPQDFFGQPHFMPEAADGEQIARLNRVRCAAREAELRAVAAFSTREGNPTREDLLRALNRMSSMLYILMILKKSGGRT
jgi:ethanolamine utilization cobalamin adenosyltransferase